MSDAIAAAGIFTRTRVNVAGRPIPGTDVWPVEFNASIKGEEIDGKPFALIPGARPTDAWEKVPLGFVSPQNNGNGGFVPRDAAPYYGFRAVTADVAEQLRMNHYKFGIETGDSVVWNQPPVADTQAK